MGRGNLAVDRIYEGHINALFLVHLFAQRQQQERWYRDVSLAGHLMGVWNTEAADGVSIQIRKDGQYELQGAKTFCSGAGFVQRPIISGKLISPSGEDLGWQMCVLPLDRHQAPIDPAFWKPLGMNDSLSYKMDFTGMVLDEMDLLGKPCDYHQQPYFSGGAIRFAAVQLGGAEAIYDATRRYLQDLNRTEEPYQRMRLGEMAVLIELGNLWIQEAGRKADQALSSDTFIKCFKGKINMLGFVFGRNYNDQTQVRMRKRMSWK
ncbi:MAG: hypothetical protein ACLFQ0_20240 [Cyclobacteriaceae bacterium]